MVRVGLVGCGLIAEAHVRGFAALGERARIVATCDLEPARAETLAAELGARATDRLEALLADPDLDAVDLCLPHHLHAPATIAALAAGKHVLCEKPIAITLADADAMIAAAERAGRVFMVCEMGRFDPHLAPARELLAAGWIGTPVLVQSTATWVQGGPYLDTAWRFDAATMGGGALIDGGIHRVSTLLALFGPVRRLACRTRRLREIFPTEDTACVLLEFADGLLGELTVCWSSTHRADELLRVIGTEGTLVARRGQVEVSGGRVPDGRLERPAARGGWHAAAIEQFIACCETGARPSYDGGEARRDLEFVLAAYESARSGRFIELPWREER